MATPAAARSPYARDTRCTAHVRHSGRPRAAAVRAAVSAVIMALLVPSPARASDPPPGPVAPDNASPGAASKPPATGGPPSPALPPSAPAPVDGGAPQAGTASEGPPSRTAGGAVPAPLDYDSPRFEPAGFPLIGGDSDIGVEFGAVGTFTKFGGGIRPYEWNIDALAAISLKTSPSGNVEVTQQDYLWQIDLPGLFGGALRVNPAVYYVSTINQGYFGLGNASRADRPAGLLQPGRYFEFRAREATLRELTRIRLHPPFDGMIATHFRFDTPSAYSSSRLAQDAAAGRVYGLSSLTLVSLGGGIIYDSRDNEYFPRTGSFHQIGVRVVEGFPFDENVRYGAFGAVLAVYKSIGGPFIAAGRAVVDAQFGNVPFYDLYTGEPFNQDTIVGGPAGVRGVPEGRYLGKLKVVGNIELRAMLVDVHVLGQAFHFGADVFFDTGRVWSDYTFHAAEDGTGIGLKWGTGAGCYVIWGQAAVFRIEAAYSPDAVAENPTLPIGLYVQDGVMF